MIWGDADIFLDRALADAAMTLCDRGSAVHIDATHWVHQEAWREVLSLGTEFLAAGARRG